MISNVEGWIRGILRSETCYKRILSESQYLNKTEIAWIETRSLQIYVIRLNCVNSLELRSKI